MGLSPLRIGEEVGSPEVEEETPEEDVAGDED